MKIQRKRGSNSVTFVFTERTLESQIRAITSFRGNIVRYLNYKVKSPYGGSVPPQDIMVTIKHGYDARTVKKHVGNEKYYDYTYTSNSWNADTQAHPTPVRLLKYVGRLMENFAADQIAKNEVNPNRNYELRDDYRFKSVTLTWIY